MGRCTLNVGTIRGGQNINSAPDEAVIGIDVRTLAGQPRGALRGDIARLLGPELELEPLLDLPGVLTDPEDPWVQRVFELTAPYLGAPPGSAPTPPSATLRPWSLLSAVRPPSSWGPASPISPTRPMNTARWTGCTRPPAHSRTSCGTGAGCSRHALAAWG